MKPLQAEFGWDRATISGAKGLSSLAASLALIAFGWMIDRWGVRRVLVPAIIGFGLIIGMMSLTNSLAVFVALQVLGGVVGAGHSPIGFVKSVSSFFDNRRGLAIGIALTGTGLGNAVVSQYAQWIITNFGWRAGFIGLGALIWVVAIPAVVFLVRDPAQALQATNSPLGKSALTDVELPGHSLAQAFRTRAFWTIAGALTLTATAVNGALLHIVPMLADRGISPNIAAKALFVFGFATICGRLLVGWSFDRWFAPKVIGPVLMLAVAGLLIVRTDTFALIGVILLGVTIGAELDMIGYLSSRYFGLRKQANISGILYALFAVGLAAGEFGYGLIHTVFHSYDIGIFVACGLLTVAAGLILTLGRYRYAPMEQGPLTVNRAMEERATT